VTIPAGLWPLIWFALALFMLPIVAQGIRLQRAPLALVEIVAVVLLVLLVMAVRNDGRSPLEQVDVCAGVSNNPGCPGYVVPVIDPAHDIPVTGVPDIRPTPSWAANPGR